MSPTRLKLIFGTIAVLGGFAIAFLIAEYCLRATSTTIVAEGISGAGGLGESSANLLVHFSDRGKRFNPNVQVVVRNHNISSRDVSIRTNSFGFRGPDFPVEKPPGEVRVLVLGDSIVAADYLPEDDVFVSIAGKTLGKTFPGRHFRLINAGVASADIEEEINLLEDVGVGVSPDIVVVAFYLNDGGPRWDLARNLNERGWLRRHSILADQLYAGLVIHWQFLATNPDVAAWVDSQDLDWSNDRADFMKFVEKARFDWGSAWGDEFWERVDSNLSRLKSLSEKYHFQVVVLCLPVAFQVSAKFVEDFPQRMLRQRAAAEGFEFRDVLPAARRHWVPDFYFDHCHPREYGNEIYARELADALYPVIDNLRLSYP